MNIHPQRGFTESEYADRTKTIQETMLLNKIDAILVTSEAEIRYFSGFHTQFFESPTRPWFMIIPADGKPIAIIPEIGKVGMEATWIEKIHTWPAPRPADDGISLLKATIKNLPNRFGRLGMPLGPETFLRMPAGDATKFMRELKHDVVDCGEMLLKQRFIKSQSEIEKIRHVCSLTSDAFEAIIKYAHAGDSELEITKKMRIDLLQKGADNTPFMVAGSGYGGYDNIIMGPTQRKLEEGDILIIDTGTVFDGYFCDFDRNFGIRKIDSEAEHANAIIHKALDSGFAAAHPGARMCDIWNSMWGVLEKNGALGNSVGRMGHGLGMLLTEWPSVHPESQVTLAPGSVITLEPGMMFSHGRQLVHEENIVITEDGAEYLTKRAPLDIPIIQ